jgi:hypothetical protein
MSKIVEKHFASLITRFSEPLTPEQTDTYRVIFYAATVALTSDYSNALNKSLGDAKVFFNTLRGECMEWLAADDARIRMAKRGTSKEGDK